MKLKTSAYSCIALFSGILLAFAFAPFNFYLFAFICPALLAFIWKAANPKYALGLGFLFGLGFFGIGASWIYISIHEFGNANILLSAAFTGLFVIVLALFIALQGYCFSRLFPHENATKIVIGFPCCWVLFEWIRSWIFTGFPWLLLGTTQTNTLLGSYAPITGVFGLSFIVVFLSAVLSFVVTKPWHTRRGTLFLIGISFLILLGSLFLNTVKWTHPQGTPLKITLVQGNIPQEIKWTSDFLSTSLNKYMQLTTPHWHSNLIVWPETAIPLLANDAVSFINHLDKTAKNNHVALITGIPVQEGFNYYNAAIALGTSHGIYYKRHLVPFGEYVPLLKVFGNILAFFDIPMSQFSEGEQQQPLIQIPQGPIALFICYEMAYENLVLTDLPQAELLVTISDDSWFGHSIAAAQHLQIAQFTALETGRYFSFDSNSGITAIINPQGKIETRIPSFQADTLTGYVNLMVGETPFVYLETKGIMGIVIGLLLVALGLQHFIQGRQQKNTGR